MTALHIAFVKIFELSLSASIIAIIVLAFRKVAWRWASPSLMIMLWSIMLLRSLFSINIPGLASLENLIDPYLYEHHYGIGAIMDNVMSRWGEILPGHADTASSSLPGYVNGFEEPRTGFLYDEEASRLRSLAAARDQAMSVIALLWLLGALIRAGVEYRKEIRTKRLLGRALPCHDTVVLALLHQCQTEAKVKARTELLLAGSVFPFIHGLLRPRIVLPYDFQSLYTESELRMIVLHELQHWKKRDGWLLLISQFILVLHWFNPLLHWAVQRLRDDAEFRCDKGVTKLLSLADKTAYGFLLLKQGDLNTRLARSGQAGSAVSWLEKRSVLMERVQAVAGLLQASPSSQRKRKLTGFMALLIGLSIFSAGNTVAQKAAEVYMPEPVLYVFWMNESLNLRSMSVLQDMSTLMIGQPVASENITLLLRQPMEQSYWEQWRDGLRLALVDKDVPIPIDTRPVLEQTFQRNIQQGHILFMLHYPSYSGKWLNFSFSKRSVTDVETLKVLQQINLY
ncbi:hypothetical protein A7K91_21040 [Paenibacillus oryzae]|uniref:Peptidase M56 domain-containing protein n=1 Tax=Paenibacillus oryzae TaxID=1844972 RepID=A0A1A5YLG2_9BACL|nr:M56 family metallopeptidase [Paenibacillus oryzae]OBR66215.1 hypothetical protein A7K91_21040 [Paenibacillus oryzae]